MTSEKSKPIIAASKWALWARFNDLETYIVDFQFRNLKGYNG
jgi:hypothetical protein